MSRSDRRRSSSRQRPGASFSSLTKPILTSQPVLLWTHEPPNFSKEELVLNPELIAAFGGVSEGSELLEVRLPETSGRTHTTKSKAEKFGSKNDNRVYRGFSRRSFVFRASQAVSDMECIERSSSTLQLSISRNIAAAFGLHNRSEVMLSKVPLMNHTISHLELYFRDQYLGRADQWRIVSLLEDSCVYVGQRITLSGCVKATIGRIFINEKKVMSGYVGPHTRAIFRSESAKYNVFIQMASEMWEFDEDGEIYYEKALSGLLPELIRRWQKANTTHVISVVLFARVFYNESEIHMLQEVALPLRREEEGKNRWYIDYYKVIVDLESDCDWPSVLTYLKEEFFRFRHDVLLLRRPVSGPAGAPWQEELHADLLRKDRALLAGKLSASHEGNILEAVNLALNPFDEHFIDRDLNRTGLDLLVISAGTGHFDVDKRLLRLTTERLIDSGIGFDLVSLSKMPLHSVPLFHFQSQVPAPDIQGTANVSGSGKKRSKAAASARPIPTGPQSAPPDPLYFDVKHASLGTSAGTYANLCATGLADFYSIPHWVDCSFYNLQQDKPFRADRFIPRCKMTEIQMLGLMENEISDITIPYIDYVKIPGVVATGQSASQHSQNAAFSPDGSGRLNKPAFLFTESFGDISGLSPHTQRRILREQFDKESFRDLEHVPSVFRPWLIHGSTDKSLPQLLSSSPPAIRGAYQTQKMGSGTDTNLRSSRDMSKVQHGQKLAYSPTNSLRTPRFARNREGVIPSPSLESHMEHPSPDDEIRKDTQPGPHGSSNPTDDTTQDSQKGNMRLGSRPSSIYSVNTLNRGVRPLEPMGKAKALVAASDINFDFERKEGAQEAASDSLAHPSATAQTLTQQKSTTPASKAKVGYSWLLSTLRGSNASSASPVKMEKEENLNQSSPLQASLKIQALLKSQVLRTNQQSKDHSKSGDEVEAKGSETHEKSVPGPILIPSQGTNEGEQEQSSPNDAVPGGVDSSLQKLLEEEDAKVRYIAQAQVEKQTLVNPCNPKKSLQPTSASQLMRWQHAFPRRLNQHVVKWRSMTTPACLPLTTVYLPSESDLKSQWQEYPYQMSISSDMMSFLVKRANSTHPALAVMREMASQRLAQGFQFIVPVSSSKSRQKFVHVLPEGEPQRFRLQEPWELFQPGSLASGNPIFLSMTNQIHRILYDRTSSCINVKRYVRKTDYDTTPFQYDCCIWPRNLSGYQTISARFSYPDNTGYNWTYLDALIAGHNEDEEFNESTRYWRTRFVVVPSEGSPPVIRGPSGEKLSDEEIRLMGMDKLADLFGRARWRPRNSKSRQGDARSMPPHNAPLRFIPTSLDPAMSLRDIAFMKQVESAREEDSVEQELRKQRRGKPNITHTTRLSETSLVDLVNLMYESADLKINDRLWNRTLYRESFSGTDFVTWLCHEFVDVNSRAIATEWGERLLKDGVLRHVHDYHGFLDGHYFVSSLCTLWVSEVDSSSVPNIPILCP